ncbi:M23 family metallopeptidase [Luteibacter aegosomaticola]|uniref:M23 family metallopeptidase n=1 Tax=Luteibacter aegosomaticola TaxID=2911538 RepID=UPI001FF7FD84|nr:M23 family metallopeptidase [Luteibacter aegosomaticola]UPG89387.1 M23 family metallopeptidase [Luteibacter aegosomaticola]
MQIILVPRGHKGPKTLNLACRRMRCKLAIMAVAGAIGIAGVGAALALAIAGPRHPVATTASDADARIARIKADSQRDIDALAVKLGQLQAQSIRLNALGERLTQVGKLDDGEFNFDEDPGQGGPELTTGKDEGAMAPVQLNQGIDDLAGQFDVQQAQLQALNDLLLDRKIESNLRPTGMPVNGYISSFFGGRPDPFSGHSARHTGIDIAAPTGTPVTAVAEGMVTFAGQRNGYGDVIEIDHGNGYMTRYAHNSKLVATVGQRVHVGDVIAKAGSTGRSTGSHVHFEVWYHDRVVNPLAFVRSHR